MADSTTEPTPGPQGLLENVQDIGETLRTNLRSQLSTQVWNQIRPALHDASAKIEALIVEDRERREATIISAEPPRKRARIESPEPSFSDPDTVEVVHTHAAKPSVNRPQSRAHVSPGQTELPHRPFAQTPQPLNATRTDPPRPVDAFMLESTIPEFRGLLRLDGWGNLINAFADYVDNELTKRFNSPPAPQFRWSRTTLLRRLKNAMKSRNKIGCFSALVRGTKHTYRTTKHRKTCRWCAELAGKDANAKIFCSTIRTIVSNDGSTLFVIEPVFGPGLEQAAQLPREEEEDDEDDPDDDSDEESQQESSDDTPASGARIKRKRG